MQGMEAPGSDVGSFDLLCIELKLFQGVYNRIHLGTAREFFQL